MTFINDVEGVDSPFAMLRLADVEGDVYGWTHPGPFVALLMATLKSDYYNPMGGIWEVSSFVETITSMLLNA